MYINKHFLIWLIYFSSSVVFYSLSSKYKIGNISDIGPGWWPNTLSIILFVLSFFTLCKGFFHKEKIYVNLKPLFLVCTISFIFYISVYKFSFLNYTQIGILPFIFVCTIIVNIYRDTLTLRNIIIHFTVVSIVSVILFKALLDSNISVIYGL